ncbi:MAG: peptidase MA family metallohydrolase [Peptococcia bacterium]|jgi:hypothetical protein
MLNLVSVSRKVKKNEPFSIKNSGLTIIVMIALLACMLSTGISTYFRKIVYRVFQQGALAMLAYQTKDYEKLASNTFILKYTKEDEELASIVLTLAEEYLQEAEKILGLKHASRQIPLVFYRDEESLKRSFGWTGDKSAVGVYWAGSIRLVSPYGWNSRSPQNSAEAREIFAREGPLAHELTHLLVDKVTGGNYPRWLTEGLAQDVEERITGFTLDEPSADRKAKAYSFKKLDKEFDEQPDQYLAYWQSFHAVRQLLARGGKERMGALLRALGKGQEFHRAFAETYGVEFADFAREVFGLASW